MHFLSSRLSRLSFTVTFTHSALSGIDDLSYTLASAAIATEMLATDGVMSLLLSSLSIIVSLLCRQALPYEIGTKFANFTEDATFSPSLQIPIPRKTQAARVRNGWYEKSDAEQPVRREVLSPAPGSLCSPHHTHCASHGHPVHIIPEPLLNSIQNTRKQPLIAPLNQEICCPINSTCHRSTLSHSHIFCCPHLSSCMNPIIECPAHTLECPEDVGGGCCPVGLRCAREVCEEYLYKTLAVWSAEATLAAGQWMMDVTRLAGEAQRTHTVAAHGEVPTSEWSGCRYEVGSGQKPIDLPISERILGQPTAIQAKLGEVAIASGAATWKRRIVVMLAALVGMSILMTTL